MPSIPPDDIDLRQLVEDCLSGKPERWSSFVAYCHRAIQAAVIRSIRRCGQLTPELADDLVQDTYVRLCGNDFRALREFRFTEPASLYGLLEAVAVSATFDYFRRKITAKRGAGLEPIPINHAAEDQTADSRGPQAAERAVLFQQIDRRLQEICAPETATRDRRVFWLYYRQGFSAKEIAGLAGIGLSAKGVESTLHRLTAQLKEIIGGVGEF